MRRAIVIACGVAAWPGCFALVDVGDYDTSGRRAQSTCPLLAPCGPCDRTRPFRPPTKLTSVSDPLLQEYSARLTGDYLTLYLHRGDLGRGDRVYVAQRSRVDEDFRAPEPLAVFESVSRPRFPAPTPDGRTVFFTADRAAADASPGRDLFWARRSTVDGAFEPPVPIDGLGTLGRNETPWVSADGAVLAFSSGDERARKLYEVSLGPAGPGDVREVDVAGQLAVDFPVESSDGLTLYFAANAGPSLLDVMVAKRPTRDAPFGTATPVSELSSTSFDWPTWVSPDECTILVSSSRDGTSDIYWARRID